MTGVELLLVVIGLVELVVCAVVAWRLAQRWRAAPSSATSSGFGIFAVVGGVVAVGLLPPVDPATTVGTLVTDVLICTLLSIPYLLARFTWALGGLSDRTHRAAAVLLAAEWVVTVALPTLPAEGAPVPAWVLPYTVFVLLAWTAQSGVAAAGLWRAGRGQSAVVRKRMRTLAGGALLMALALTLTAGNEVVDPGPREAVVGLLGLLSVLLFAVAFLAPPALRLVWRQGDLAALSSAEQGLMTATSTDEVGRTILPVLGRVLGGGGAALLDPDGVCLHAAAFPEHQLDELAGPVTRLDPAAPVQPVAAGALAARLGSGWLVVQAGRLTPVFGDDEAVLLGRVATLVDLALQRVALFEQERASRAAAEAASAELETLLYSVSHDLRSPLISVLGYLDCLQQEHASELSGDGPHYLERISVNAVYMQSLISDLLELSRIGRRDPVPVRLDLHALASEVVEAARLSAPAADVAVVGTLPPVRVNDVRARQLLTNLVDNALRHGGRDDLRVTVRADVDEVGRLLLEVADDGRGVPEEYRQRVVQVFERLDAPKSSPGTGMGLAICKRIAESLGGTLAVGGPPDGAPTGTTVTITLPAEVRSAELPAPRVARPRDLVDTPSEGRP